MMISRHPVPGAFHSPLIDALAGLPLPALLVDGGGRIVYANPPLLALFGYPAEALHQQMVEMLLPESTRSLHPTLRVEKRHHFRSHAMGHGFRIFGRHCDGSDIPLEIRLQTCNSESDSCTAAFLSDQRQVKTDPAELERLNRSLRLLHNCNEILVRARNEEDLLSGIVRSMARIGGYRQVWAGLLPLAEGCFITSSCADHLGECTTGGIMKSMEFFALRAIHGKVPLLFGVNDCLAMRSILDSIPCEDDLPAMIALPLHTASATYGCLCLTSTAGNAFLPKEIEILQELADDLAFGIEAQRNNILRLNAENRLRLLERAVEASPNAVIITDALDKAHPILYVNPAFEKITGYSASEAIGCNGRMQFGDDLEQPALEEIRAALRGRYSARALVRNYRKDGGLFWNDMTIAPILDAAGVVTHFVSVMNDFTAHKLQEEEIERHAVYDALTGLPNRYSLFERIAQAAGDAERDGHMVGVVLIALNRFSLVNDAYGHDAGDELLRAVGARLHGTLRAHDTVARLGGDEFVVLLTRLAPDDVMAVVDKVHASLTHPFKLACNEVMISASIGVCMAPRDGSNAQELIRNAEVAMQGAKTGGWNAVRFYAEEMNRRSGERLAMEFDLRRALERQEFEIYYQPIIDADSGRIVEAEALLRWDRPQHGLVAPDDFIPLAESSGLIVPIGKWVLHEACRQNAAWRAAGLPPISIGVNLSARQFRETDLEIQVAEALARHGLTGGDLVLEVTESLLMTNIDAVSETLLRLKQLGVRISLDDFGTGYSSLSYLKRLPLDTLKIDRSFVRDIGTDPNDAAIATTIISMARTMHLGVIAEGVETEEQFTHLRLNGCQRVQGYLFSPPVAAARFEKQLCEQLAVIGG